MEGADLIILNTCGCLNSLQEKAKQAISRSVDSRKDKNQKIIVAGCYPLIDKGNNLKELEVNFFPPGDIDEFSRLLDLKAGKEMESNSLTEIDLVSQPAFVTKPHVWFKRLSKLEELINVQFLKLHNFMKAIMMSSQFHYVTVGKGCLGNCTFCGIKLAIGGPVSRPLHEIINGIRVGILNGKKDIWLVSDDIGCWGHDINKNSADLLEEILLIPSEMNLVLNYFEPEMFVKYYDRLKVSLSDRRIIQICLPLQTGSQRLLKRMGRSYDIADVLKKVDEIRKINPRLVIKTQYITAFPGETWRDIIKTFWSMRKFDGIGVNTYARVKYTPAYRLKPLSDKEASIRRNICDLFVKIFHFRFVLNSLTQYHFLK